MFVGRTFWAESVRVGRHGRPVPSKAALGNGFEKQDAKPIPVWSDVSAVLREMPKKHEKV